MSEENLPTNANANPSNKLQKNSQARTEWVNQLALCVDQAFDVFNIYGRQPEAAGNVLQAFAMILNGYTHEEISKAFIQWMKKSAVMPTPHDIYNIVSQDTSGDDSFEWVEAPSGASGLNVYTFGGKNWIKKHKGRK